MAMNQANLPCGPEIPLPKGPKDARYVENIMEHAFLSEVLQHCWFIRNHPVEVIRPDVDAGGYDIVLEADGRVRHVQLKSRWKKAAGPKVLKINSRLRKHQDPCVVWIFWDADPACQVTLRYMYSEKVIRHSELPEWPEPLNGAGTFELRRAHFLPNHLKTSDMPHYLKTSDVVTLLFGPPTAQA